MKLQQLHKLMCSAKCIVLMLVFLLKLVSLFGNTLHKIFFFFFRCHKFLKNRCSHKA